MRISDWSSDVCSSDLVREQFHDLYGSFGVEIACGFVRKQHVGIGDNSPRDGDALLLAAGQFGGCMIPPILQTYFFQRRHAGSLPRGPVLPTIEEGKFDILKRAGPREQRSEEHTSELQSLMRISYAVFCLKKKQNTKQEYKTKIQVITKSES